MKKIKYFKHKLTKVKKQTSKSLFTIEKLTIYFKYFNKTRFPTLRNKLMKILHLNWQLRSYIRGCPKKKRKKRKLYP